VRGEEGGSVIVSDLKIENVWLAPAVLQQSAMHISGTACDKLSSSAALQLGSSAALSAKKECWIDKGSE
jgi:hypothetical protein